MTTNDKRVENGVTRREALASIGGVAAGVALVSSGVTSKALAAGCATSQEGDPPGPANGCSFRASF